MGIWKAARSQQQSFRFSRQQIRQGARLIGLAALSFLLVHACYSSPAQAASSSLLPPMAIGGSNSPWFYQGVTQLAYAGIIIWIILLLQRSGK
jgi:hypothetical protein